MVNLVSSEELSEKLESVKDSTLKTYKIMGGKILLMPENDAYEPFMLDEDQFSILGVAIGIIKN